jgi:hypothetical protein
VPPELLATLPPPWLPEQTAAAGALFGATGIAFGAGTLGTAMPIGVALTALVPLALGSVYLPRHNLVARALTTSAACLPIGLGAASLLELAAWPYAGTAALVLGPALAAGYTCFHLAASRDMDADVISAPTSPLCRLLHAIGLWAPWTPWAHAGFRSSLKLFGGFTLLATLPSAAALYGGYHVWLVLVAAWQTCLQASVAAMFLGFLASSLPTMVPAEHRGAVAWLLPTSSRWGHWLLNNPVTHAMWLYAFYAFLPMCGFFLWYKWTYGVKSSPFKASDGTDTPLFQGQRAFWRT